MYIYIYVDYILRLIHNGWAMGYGQVNVYTYAHDFPPDVSTTRAEPGLRLLKSSAICEVSWIWAVKKGPPQMVFWQFIATSNPPSSLPSKWVVNSKGILPKVAERFRLRIYNRNCPDRWSILKIPWKVDFLLSNGSLWTSKTVGSTNNLLVMLVDWWATDLLFEGDCQRPVRDVTTSELFGIGNHDNGNSTLTLLKQT